LTFLFSSSPASFAVKDCIKNGRVSSALLQLVSDLGRQHVSGPRVDLSLLRF
jgi:hypothetical protein